MYVSNLTNRKLGLNSPVVLRPNEINRWIDDDNKKLVESVLRAKAANLVSVSYEPGMVKTIAASAVRTLTFDAGAVGSEPRSTGKHAESVKAVLKERITKGTEDIEVLKEVAKQAEAKVEEEEAKTASTENNDELVETEVVKPKSAKSTKTAKHSK